MKAHCGPSLVQFGACGNAAVHHQQVQALVAIFLMHGGDQHTLGIDAHHLARGRAVPGDFKAHVTALHDSRIETEARRIVDKLKDLSAPNSPNKTHFMVEISPHFDALASAKDNDRLFAMLPYKSLCFTSIKDRHGVYAMINKDERRDVSIRKPRPSIRKQLADSKQATSPKKAAARAKKNELEV